MSNILYLSLSASCHFPSDHGIFVGPQDYEYASYNAVAYDIANHFCEMAADYHTETPHILDFSKYPGKDVLFASNQYLSSHPPLEIG